MATSRKRGKFWLTLGLGGTALWCLLGASAGIGTYTFYYADGASYLSNDAASCANCHVMQGHYDAWIKSSHSSVATCNDCHAPHDSLANKLFCKGRNGFFHSLAFTTDNFPDQILINDYNRGVTEQACRHCHSAVVHAIDVPATGSVDGEIESMSCIRCHNEVGHSR